MAKVSAGDVQIDWKGVQVDKEVREGMRQEFITSAEAIASTARNIASAFKDTGDHQKSIHAVPGKKGRFTFPSARVIGDNLTGLLEWGTKKMAPRKHMYPALDREIPNLKRRLEDKFK